MKEDDFGVGVERVIFLMSNKMHINPETSTSLVYQQPQPNYKLRKNSIKMGQFGSGQSNRRVRSIKNYHLWKEKRAKTIQFQEIQSQDKQPLFSIALTCGVKNGKNEILEEYLCPTQDKEKSDANANSFQKILSQYKNPKLCIDKKRLTFVNFKTKRSSQDGFFPQAREQSQSQKRTKSQPKDMMLSKASDYADMRRTGFPKQLVELKQQIRELPVVKKLRKKSSKPTTASKFNLSLLERYNNPSFNQSMMQSMLRSNIDDFQQTYERKVFHCKSENSRDYVEELKEVITYADEVMQEQVKQMISKEEAALQPEENDELGFKKQKIAIYRKYWPEYRRHTINLCQGKDQQATFFSNFPQSDCQLDTSLQSLVSTIKVDFIRQQKIMNREIVESEKNSIDKRFKYKINFQRENYKRNVRSFLKCKKEYRIERKREEVRANGITRMKKSNNVQKAFQKVVQVQEED